MATAVVNSFPKDRDYRREAMQAAPTSFTPTSEYKPLSHLSTQSCFILCLVHGFQQLLVTFEFVSGLQSAHWCCVAEAFVS